MASFNTLPAEIIHYIVEITAGTSLPALHSLVRASRQCYLYYVPRSYSLTTRAVKSETGRFFTLASNLRQIMCLLEIRDALKSRPVQTDDERENYWRDVERPEIYNMDLWHDLDPSTSLFKSKVFPPPEFSLQALKEIYQVHAQIRDGVMAVLAFRRDPENTGLIFSFEAPVVEYEDIFLTAAYSMAISAECESLDARYSGTFGISYTFHAQVRSWCSRKAGLMGRVAGIEEEEQLDEIMAAWFERDLKAFGKSTGWSIEIS